MGENKEHKFFDLDELLVQTENNIEKFGLQVISVSASEYLPSFAYSIGFYKTYHSSEIICFGLPSDIIHAVLNDVADLIKNREKIGSQKNYDNIFKNGRAEFLVVDERNIGDYFGVTLNFYKDIKFPALQLVWTDRNDKFPWEENFEEKFLRDQPLLDRNAEFKFREADNLGRVAAPFLRLGCQRQFTNIATTIMAVNCGKLLLGFVGGEFSTVHSL